ncbi:sigma-70 family RNA polymerase sigma factor [Mycolicibacterium bacteremicum]|uniref:sigma-70 family RNA polymerase sigma factor n=1 Tax=Mycolicibacterium bacteremicum TaxID=564198 RepID=UPI0026EF7790|nr:sigma-70 family RNA polymerase sigma factor [Mycolicibacterium bacteremicum]
MTCIDGTDGPLVERSGGHEIEYLTALFVRDVGPLRGELLRAAVRLTNDSAAAEDLVQDAYLRAYRSFATFSPETNVRAWMYRILKNAWITNYRAMQRRLAEVPTPEFTELEVRADRERGVDAGPEAALLARQPDEDVLAAMAELSDEFRIVVYLADVEGYPYATIARMMGTPIGTVTSRIHRARQQLRVQLGSAVCHRRLIKTAA